MLQAESHCKVYWTGGFVLSVLAVYRLWKHRIDNETANQLKLQPGFGSIVPNRITQVPEEDYDYESDEEDEIEAPFVKKKWHHFITKYFERKKPPIDKTMLALHISAMSMIHKAKLQNLLKNHVPFDDSLL
ncbi:uncharacterized protein LOC144745927 [Ciona intestinalis]